jgi:hypothetical protein
MLTVKVILPNGDQYIKEVSSVWMDKSTKDHPARVKFYERTLCGDQIEEGDVYVMNENGKTIADYHLHCPVDTQNSFHLGSNGNPEVVMKDGELIVSDSIAGEK